MLLFGVKTYSYFKETLNGVLRLLGETDQFKMKDFFQKEGPLWKLLVGFGLNQVPVSASMVLKWL